MRYIKFLGIALGLVIAVSSLVGLWDTFSEDGASGVLLQLLREYERITGSFFRLIEPAMIELASIASGLFGWKLALYAHWKDVFALLVLYISAHVSDAYMGRFKNPIAATAIRSGWGALCTVAASIAAGSIPLAGDLGSVIIVAYSLAGVVAYRLGFSVQFASDRFRYAQEPFWKSFGDKASGAMIIGIGGIAICAIGSQIGTVHLLGEQVSTGFIVLIAVLVFLGIFHLSQALAGETSDGVSVNWARVVRKGNAKIAFRILATVVLTLFAIAGLS